MARKGVKNIQAKKTVVDGIQFDSKFEAEHYTELKLREAAKEIFHLKTHVTFPLENVHAGIYVRELRGNNVRKYTADFTYVEPDPTGAHKFKKVAVDTKGRMEKIHSLRISVFRALYPDVEHRIVKQAPKRRKRR